MKTKIDFFLRLITSIILFQSLYFKFTGHKEAVHIFSTLEVEPWGRILLGCIEFIIGVMLLLPKSKFYGVIGAIGLMVGAIGTHLFTPVGIVVQWGNKSDNGQLFGMAIVAFLCSVISFLIQRKAVQKQQLS
ncbi:MAG: DoxX family protein [Bacteroidetes bacterium]|nr:DoxX family protein [Bacteroidota bacterium]